MSQRRESAAIVALGELLERSVAGAEFRLHQVLKGKDRLSSSELILRLDLNLQRGSLALLMGEGPPAASPSELTWSCDPVNEIGYSYFAQAPSLRTPTVERLRYFARFLEHAEPLIAEDAYAEFGHAPYDQVAEVADAFSAARLRAWLADPAVAAQRKGFYGLALALAARQDDRHENLAFLRRLVLKPADDFRAGFDGLLGGYLVLGGEPALATIESRFLANPEAADGDVRHAIAALRFYQEFGEEIPLSRLQAAMRHLLARPEFAAVAVIDLARWQDWDAQERIVGLYDSGSSPAFKRAVVGYLLASPRREAAAALERLRKSDPAGIQEAQRHLALFGTPTRSTSQ